MRTKSIIAGFTLALWGPLSLCLPLLAQASPYDSKDILQQARLDVSGVAGSEERGPLAKVGFDLAIAYHDFLAQQQLGLSPATGQLLNSSNTRLQVAGDRVKILAIADKRPGAADALRTELETLGLQHTVHDRRRIAGELPLAAIPAMAALPVLNYARPVYDAPPTPRASEPMHTSGSTASEFVINIGSDVVANSCPADYLQVINVAAGDVDALKAAIHSANTYSEGTVIDLAPGIYSLTTVDNEYVLSDVVSEPNGLPQITGKICLRGAAAETTVIERAVGAPAMRVLQVRESAELTIFGITIRNGDIEGYGAGISNTGGKVTLMEVAVHENFADGECWEPCGVGIANTGAMSITQSVIANNRASDGVGAGGIGNSGKMEINQAVLFHNGTSNNDGGGILNDAIASLTISHSTITYNFSGEDDGGGIENLGTLWIQHSTVSHNSSCENKGGGINNRGTVHITNTTLFSNYAYANGGGIYNSGSLYMENSTVADNYADYYGGGIYNAGIANTLNATVAANSAYIGGGITSAYESQTTVTNTIVAENFKDTYDDYPSDCNGNIRSGGNNLIGNLRGCYISLVPSDQFGNAGLGAYVDNSEPGRGHYPILRDSPAIDAGNPANCSNKDQLDQGRTDGNGDSVISCDIGAIEFLPSLPPGKPTLLSPSGQITDNTPTYTWEAVANADEYKLVAYDSTGLALSRRYSAAEVGCRSGVGLCSITPAKVLARGNGKWKVKGSNAYGAGLYANRLEFTVENDGADGVPAQPTLISPSGTITDNTPTYTWKAVVDTDEYKLLVYDSTGVVISRRYSAEEADCASGTGSCSITPTTALAKGDGKWKVKGKNQNGSGLYSKRLNFTVK